MLKQSDITEADYEVIRAIANNRKQVKRYTLDSSEMIVRAAINKSRRSNWK